MKLLTILGDRILVQPLDLIKKKAGSLHLPSSGEMMTAGASYQASVLQIGDGEKIRAKAHVQTGARVLLIKGGALELADGTRIIYAEDIIAVIDPSEPIPE